MRSAPVKVEAEYRIPIEHHNPMEPHAAIAVLAGRQAHDLRQDAGGLRRPRSTWRRSFGVPEENVTVVSPFVGGAFGSSLRPNYYPALTAMAARELKRPVKVVYTRTQMFTGHGYRPYTIQKIALGAERSGKLSAMIHEAVHNTSSFEEFSDGTTGFTRQVYACPNLYAPLKIADTDLNTPTWMRAPGAVSGMFALECAMDELAYALKIDPLELRLINYAEVDPESGKPLSSKALRECYRLGAEKFGWKDRKFEPRSMRDGRLLVGWGMATGVWGAFQKPAERADHVPRRRHGARRQRDQRHRPRHLHGDDDDRRRVPGAARRSRCSSSSATRGSRGRRRRAARGRRRASARPCYGAALAVGAKLLALANQEADSPLQRRRRRGRGDARRPAAAQERPVAFRQHRRSDAAQRPHRDHRDVRVAARRRSAQKYATLAHGAQFVEVKVDPDLGQRPRHARDRGHGLRQDHQPKASHSQEIGGVVWGIGMALQEATEIDHRYGRIMNPNLQHYHVPVNADVHEIETMFVEEDDTIVNPLGVKGMGELGMVGIPAAIANAVFHATGRRIRELPITPDKLL